MGQAIQMTAEQYAAYMQALQKQRDILNQANQSVNTDTGLRSAIQQNAYLHEVWKLSLPEHAGPATRSGRLPNLLKEFGEEYING